MQEVNAASRADKILDLLIEHHPNLFQANVPILGDLEKTKKAAQFLAEFRAELTKLLTPQP